MRIGLFAFRTPSSAKPDPSPTDEGGAVMSVSQKRPGSRDEVARMAWPLSIGMLSFTLMGLIDTLLMGRVGTVAQAGVGLGAIAIYAFAGFFRGLAAGPQALVAAGDGAGNPLRVRRAGTAGPLFGLAGGLVLGLIVWLVGTYALGPLADDPAVVAEAGPYVRIRALAMPLSIGAWGMMTALQGLGDTRTRMWASLVGNAVNIGLDLVLIFGLGPIPAMGAAGAAWATNIGELAMFVVFLVVWLRRFGRPVWPGREVAISGAAVGLPAGLQWAQSGFAFGIMSVVLARVGPAHLAANQIVINVMSLSFLPGYALSEAAGVLVGRYLGAGRRAGAARSVRSARQIAWVIMGLCGVGFVVFGGAIGSLFTHDPEVQSLVVSLLMLAAVVQLFDAAAMVHFGALRGAGDTRFTLLVTIGGSWGLLVPLAVGLGYFAGWGALGTWTAMCCHVVFAAVVSAPRVAGLGRGRVGRMDLLLGS